MKHCLYLVFLAALALVQPVLLQAREVGGVQLPDQIELGGHALILNGAGVRTKFIFDVYAGGLYLQAPCHEAGQVISRNAPMLVRMHFIYDGIAPEKMQHGWQKGFTRLAPDADQELRRAMQRYVSLFTATVHENDIYDIGWLPGSGLSVRFNGKLLGRIDSLALKKVLFTIWFGPDPADEDLKEGMLGND
jgi:hypothetical protein